jgi:transposase
MKKPTGTIEKIIIKDLVAGMSTGAVAEKHAVSRWKARQLAEKEKGNVQEPKRGRPSKISAKTRRLMVREVTNGTLQTAVDVQKRLSEDFSEHVSANRVRRILKQEGLTADHKEHRPRLTAKHLAERMGFVRKYEHWTINDWKRVMNPKSTEWDLMATRGSGKIYDLANRSGFIARHQETVEAQI